MEIFLPENKLPNDNEYVLAYFKNRPWVSPNTEQHKWVVVRFVKGISIADRAKLPDINPRKRTYSFGDEDDNNKVPYEWNSFGSGAFCGQEATCWCYLPTPIKG